MYAHDGRSILRQCMELTEQIETYLTTANLSLSELAMLESLYGQRQALLVSLQQWWDRCAYQDWSREQARELIVMTQELLHRSTRQQELIRLLLQRAEQRLRSALLQHRVVRYIEGENDGHRSDTAASLPE